MIERRTPTTAMGTPYFSDWIADEDYYGREFRRARKHLRNMEPARRAELEAAWESAK